MTAWILLTVITTLIPLIMTVFGAIFKKRAPVSINYIFGYRTPMSTASPEAWDFAHRYFGRLWFITGIILLIPSIAVMLSIIRLDEDTVGNIGSAIIYTQLFFMILPIIPTEIALRKNFDKNGNRKNEDI